MVFEDRKHALQEWVPSVIDVALVFWVTCSESFKPIGGNKLMLAEHAINILKMDYSIEYNLLNR